MIKNFTISTGKDYTFGYVTKQEVYGGVDYQMMLDSRMMDDLIWLRTHRDRMEKEAKAREENPALASAYEQYRTMMDLLLDTH